MKRSCKTTIVSIGLMLSALDVEFALDLGREAPSSPSSPPSSPQPWTRTGRSHLLPADRSDGVGVRHRRPRRLGKPDEPVGAPSRPGISQQTSSGRLAPL